MTYGDVPPSAMLWAPGRSNGDVLRASLAYMVTGLASMLLMGLLGLLMRLDQAGMLIISPTWFYRVMTLHGSGMIASVLLAAMGGIAAAVSPTTRLSARALWIALVIYMMGNGFVVLATLVGGFAGGWTVLYPLPEHGLVWSLGSALAIYAGYLFVALGLFLFCVQMLIALARSHGGLTKALAWRFLFSFGRDTRDALPRPVELIAGVIAIDGIAAATAGAIYLIPLFAQASHLITSVDALFAKNFVLLFGHTIANLSIYVTAGLVYAALPAYAKRAWPLTWPVAAAWNLIIPLMLLNYSHHLYADFAQPFALQLLGEIGSYAVALPSFIVTIIGALALMYRSGMRWSSASIFFALGLWGWVFGGMGALLDATIPVNQVMHNTLWVVAHFHTYFVLGALAFAWAYLSYMVEMLSPVAAHRGIDAATWLYGVGGAGFILMFFVSGANSVPRRFAVHLPQWQIYGRIAVPFVVLLALSLAWISWDLGTRMRSAWRATLDSSGVS
jgi:cytochrome c oxidase subunit 1